VDDFELGPIATLYEEWALAYPEPRDPAIEQRLAATYRDAWATGDPIEREYIYYFIYDRKSFDQDRDLILEGLHCEDVEVARGAATAATVAIHYHVDLGPEILPAFRAAALRFPLLDLHRWGHLRQPGDGWPKGRPFIQLYERWMTDTPRDEALGEQLASIAQETWNRGDPAEQAFVLQFLWYHREPRVDLVLEGIQSDTYGLAETALFEAEAMLRDGYDLGPDIRRLTEEHERRFHASLTRRRSESILP
jgi:hypothetical protein